MHTLQLFFDSPWVPAILVGMVLLEAVGLILWHRATGRGPRPLVTVSFLGAGASLISAMVYHRQPDGAVGFAFMMFVALGLHLWHLSHLMRR